MRLDGASCHVELFGNFRIVTAFEQQIGDLLLSRTQVYGFDFHDLAPGLTESPLGGCLLVERAKVPRQRMNGFGRTTVDWPPV